MQPVRTLLIVPLVLATMASTPASAGQQHLVPSSQLAATVADDVAKQDASRAAVREALDRPEVREMAARLGVDLARASAAVDTLSGADLTRAADAAAQVNEQLVGGASTVTFSTTTIIIVLLLIILLIIAIR